MALIKRWNVLDYEIDIFVSFLISYCSQTITGIKYQSGGMQNKTIIYILLKLNIFCLILIVNEEQLTLSASWS